MEHDITKALEIWTLQTLLNISILLGILALGLALLQGYYRALEKHLTLRVSIELWRVATVLMVNVILVVVVLVGLLLFNPDIMSDIKMAVPFYPVATVLFAAALVLRLFHGGHEAGSKSYFRAIYLMALACLVNLAGFTLVTEGSSPEYLEAHPDCRPFWDYVKNHLCSNVTTDSLDLAQITFYIGFPLLLAVLAWGFFSALKQIKAAKGD